MRLVHRIVRLCSGLMLTFGFAVVAHPESKSVAAKERERVSEVIACFLSDERQLMVGYVTERRGNPGRLMTSRCAKKTANGHYSRAGSSISADVLVGRASVLLLRQLDLGGYDPVVSTAPDIKRYPPMTVERMSPTSKLSLKDKVVWMNKVNETRNVDIASECLVRHHPAIARSLIIAQDGSPTERTIHANLVANGGACMADGALRADPWVLRNAVAQNYLGLLHLADAKFKEKLL